MTDSPPTPDSTPGADTAGWSGITASVRGASHERNGRPNQDAVRLQYATGPVPGLVAAVSDGHGGDRYTRSDRGSRIGVEVACEVGQLALTEMGPIADTETVSNGLADLFAGMIVSTWTERVLANLADQPFSQTERDLLGVVVDDHPTVAYGATLVMVVCAPTWLGMLQIGDGDIVTVTLRDVDSPVPGDDRLVANETTSLCLPTAETDARTAAICGQLPDMVMVTSDGYANSFASPSWRSDTSLDMTDQVAEKGLIAVGSLLPGWLKESAVAGGDDVSMALVVRNPAALATGSSGLNPDTSR